MKKIGMLGGMSWTWSAEYHGLVNEEVSHRREFVAALRETGATGLEPATSGVEPILVG